MKIQFFKQEALDYFKTNVTANSKYYLEPVNEWVYEQFDNPFFALDKEISEFEFYFDENNTGRMDLENSKRLYSAMKCLTPSQACDERLWAGLAHGDFYGYVKQRWSGTREINNMKKVNYIYSRYFFTSTANPKMRHTLAKLWWIGRLTFDETNTSNPYYLLDILSHRDATTRISDLFTSNFSRNIHMLRPFLKAIDSYESKGFILNQDFFRSAVQYMNALGGIYLLDVLSEEEIENKIIERIKFYQDNGPDVVKGIKSKKINHRSTIRIYSKNKNDRFILDITDSNIEYFLGKKYGEVVNYKGDELKILSIF